MASRVSGPWVAPVIPDVVWIGGDDALRFLNDLVSQELSSLGDGGSVRSFLLKPDGKLGYSLFVVKSGDSYGLVTEPDRGEGLAGDLSRYRIRVDVTIEVESRDRWLVMGEWDGIDVSWDDQPRHLVIGEQPDLTVGTESDYESERVRAGEPAWGREMTEGTIPHETTLVAGSVDFDKGCFLGQELVARMDSRGATAPRMLRRLELSGGAEPGSEIHVEDAKVGELTSVSDGIGLGLVKRSVEPGATVSIGEASAIVSEIPQKARR